MSDNVAAPAVELGPSGLTVTDKALLARIRAGEEASWFPISFSSAWEYKTCPRRWKLKKDLKLDFSGDLADMGTEIHAVSESVEAGEEHEETDVPLGTEKTYFELKEKLLAKGREEGVETEVELFAEWEIRPGLRAQFRAFIDRLKIDGGTAFIDDYKTGQVQKYDEHETQRKSYSLVVLRNYPEVWKVEARTVYLRWQDDPARVKPDIFGVGDIEEFAVALEALVRRMATDEKFDPKPGPHCKHCDVAHMCDAGQRFLQPYSIDGNIKVPKQLVSREEYRQAVLAKFHLDKLQKDLNLALHDALDRFGAMELEEYGGAYAAHINVSKRVKDIPLLLDVARNHSIPYEEVVTFNAQRAKKYVEGPNAIPELAEAAAETVDRYPKKEFRAWKKEKKSKKEEAA